MIKKLIPFVLLAVAIASAQSGQRIAQATQNVNGFVKVVSGASVTVCTYPSCNAHLLRPRSFGADSAAAERGLQRELPVLRHAG